MFFGVDGDCEAAFTIGGVDVLVSIGLKVDCLAFELLSEVEHIRASSHCRNKPLMQLGTSSFHPTRLIEVNTCQTLTHRNSVVSVKQRPLIATQQQKMYSDYQKT